MDFGYDDIAVFLAVARKGRFNAAAAALGMPVSTVSRRVAALEAQLGVPLLRRTTRAVALTADGAAFAARCETAFEEIRMAVEALGQQASSLRGPLRVTAPHYVCNAAFGSNLLEFARRNPGIQMDLRLTNAVPDLVEDGIDLSFQLGPLRDSGDIARRLWSVPYVLCVSPDLLKRRPELARLTHPRQLSRHPCVVTRPLQAWTFQQPGESVFAVTPSVQGAVVDDLGLGANAVREGLGVGYLPRGLVGPEFGVTLTEVGIPDWPIEVRDLFAVYPPSRQLSPKVRALIDFALEARLAHG